MTDGKKSVLWIGTQNDDEKDDTVLELIVFSSSFLMLVLFTDLFLFTESPLSLNNNHKSMLGLF